MRPKRRLFARGESVVASMGFAIMAILLAVVGGTAWCALRAQRASVCSARLQQVRAVSALLSQSAEHLLAANELSGIRRLTTETAQTYDFEQCRIVLGNGHILADADPSQISLQPLPRPWPKGTMEARPTVIDDKNLSLSYLLEVPGRGPARLDISAPVTYPGWIRPEAQAGVGIIGAVALTALLFVYRGFRSRLQAVGAIRESLLAFEGGETTPAVLAVSAALGIEARAWNTLLEENAQLRRKLTVRQAKESLGSRREAKGDLEAACHALSQGVILVDEKGRVRFVNGAAAVFLRGKREDILGGDIAEFIQDEGVLESIRAATASGSVGWQTTAEVEQEGSGGGLLRFSVRPIRSQDASAAAIIIEDLTQHRVAEESRNAFVAQATHELRTPLTNIRLYAETALDEGGDDPALRAKCLNIINQEARRLERMVGDILSVAEIEAGSFKIHKDDVHLDVIFDHLRSDYEGQAKEKQIELVFNLPPKLPVLQGDRDKIVLALHNLIGNAIKYTPPGGKVTVNVETNRTHLVVEVSDTGIGISEEDAKRVFEKFYRSEDERVVKTTGSGLGLALAREVIRLHGGDITVQSELDNGSTFALTLPLPGEAARNEDSGAKTRRGDGPES